MDTNKQSQIFEQYINQYQPVINSTLKALRANKNNLQIPYAQFLFSIIDYYGLLYSVASKNQFKKRKADNFKEFLASDYFPQKDRSKKSLLYLVRNGVMHQIFPKACALGLSKIETLFYEDKNEIVILNLEYLDRITIMAIESFKSDLITKHKYVENLFDLLISEHYGFDDHKEFNDIINEFFGGNRKQIFD